MSKSSKLKIATCQFAEGFRPRRNGAIVRRYLAKAAKRGADIVHFHECALSGYGPEIAREDYDWAALREATESVMAEAAKRRIWVAVGSSHPLTGSNHPHNSLYLISPAGKIVDRYDKRFLTAGDIDIFTAGDHWVTFELKGVRCGLLICYDVRFPKAYEELYKLGVKVVFQSFHNAHYEAPTIHEHIMRQTVQAQAGMHGMCISATNSSARYSAWPSVFVTPDGRITGQLPRNRSGLMVNTFDPAADYYSAGVQFRDQAIRGALHTGRTLCDARSRDRTSL
jgi:predicted amidohydrolase